LEFKFVYTKQGEVFIKMRYHMDCGVPHQQVRAAGWVSVDGEDISLFGRSAGYGLGCGSMDHYDEIIQKIKEKLDSQQGD